MPSSTVARVYAETLLRFAEREAAVEPATEGIVALARLVAEDDRFRRFLDAPQIPAGVKRSVAHAAFEGWLHPVVMKFLDLVIERHREPLLAEIADTWNELLDRRANRQAATVTTVAPADPGLIERLRDALEQATGKTIDLEERVDPGLLGGIVVRTGDLVMDSSLRSRLATLRHRLRTAGKVPA
ncbi:MAG TPA: ATP synthase F1 subunit delta [Gemmatimonadota bacterium]|nr:ATP synthase F1 subunit delta [Gemmatimonadota bacterium]